MNFKAGDRVIVNGSFDCSIFKKHTGLIVIGDSAGVMIEFDCPFYDEAGDRHGHGHNKQCWNFPYAHFHLISKEPKITTFNERLKGHIYAPKDRVSNIFERRSRG